MSLDRQRKSGLMSSIYRPLKEVPAKLQHRFSMMDSREFPVREFFISCSTEHKIYNGSKFSQLDMLFFPFFFNCLSFLLSQMRPF